MSATITRHLRVRRAGVKQMAALNMKQVT